MRFHELFGTEIDEAAPDDNVRAKTYYHGTSSTRAANVVATEGLKGRETQGKGMLAPVAGRVYITSDIAYAIMYALGGNFTHAMQEAAGDFKDDMRTDPYGYVFVIKGADLVDVQPDEDSIGEFYSHNSEPITQMGRYGHPVTVGYKCSLPQSDYAGRQLYDYIGWSMTENQRKRVLDGEYAYFAQGGKRVLKKMPDHLKIEAINRGMHVAHAGTIHPSECWRMLKTDLKLLKKDGSNFFSVAEKI
jgi:hypothetical protein